MGNKTPIIHKPRKDSYFRKSHHLMFQQNVKPKKEHWYEKTPYVRREERKDVIRQQLSSSC